MAPRCTRPGSSATERILTTAADENNVNLVRRTVRQSDGNGLDLTYYIRLNHPTKIFNRARLTGANTLTNSETQTTGTVLSTKPGATKETPQSLANSYDLTFRPLEDMFANLPAIGVYKAETGNRRDFEGFLESISRQVNEEILETDPDAALTTPATFVEDTDDAVDAQPLSTTPLLALSGTLAALVIVATTGALARDAAALGVQRLRLLPHASMVVTARTERGAQHWRGRTIVHRSTPLDTWHGYHNRGASSCSPNHQHNRAHRSGFAVRSTDHQPGPRQRSCQKRFA